VTSRLADPGCGTLLIKMAKDIYLKIYNFLCFRGTMALSALQSLLEKF